MAKRKKDDFILSDLMSQEFKTLISDNKISQFRIQSAQKLLKRELLKKNINIEHKNSESPNKEEQCKDKLTELKKERENLLETYTSMKKLYNLKNKNKRIKSLKEEQATVFDDLNFQKQLNITIFKEIESFPEVLSAYKNILHYKFTHKNVPINILKTPKVENKKYFNNFPVVSFMLKRYDLENNNNLCTGDFKNIQSEIMLYKNIFKNSCIEKSETQKEKIINLSKQILSFKTVLNRFHNELSINSFLNNSEIENQIENLKSIKSKIETENLFLRDLINEDEKTLNEKALLKNKQFFIRFIEKLFAENNQNYDLKKNFFQIIKFIENTEIAEALDDFLKLYEKNVEKIKEKINLQKNSQMDAIKTHKGISEASLNYKLENNINGKKIEMFNKNVHKFEEILKNNAEILEKKTKNYKKLLNEKNNKNNLLADFLNLNFKELNISKIIQEINEYRIKITCSVCDKNIKNAVIENCMHTFCYDCLKSREKARKRDCPTCQKSFGNFIIKKFTFN